jgi:DNA polymerase III epsilon subunit-like protein
VKHVMVDLETMGKGPRAAIVQIGAVEFGTSGLGREFEATVDLESSVAAGLEMDADTVKWWLRQGDAARESIGRSPKQTLPDALEGFTAFFKACEAEFLWGNGATFDCVILTSAYQALGKRPPQHFRDDRDMRTFRHIMQALGIDPKIEFSGTAHDGLTDARNQARLMVECLTQFTAAIQRLRA